MLLDPQAANLSGDPERLQQVVWNLLSNAIKFTPKNGRVEIRLERVNSHVEIAVSDNGKGIEAEFLPFVFDRFRQSDGSMARRHGGLGLGLSIVRQIVELHGGTVSVESEGAEKGASFWLSLPVLPLWDESLALEPVAHTYAGEVRTSERAETVLSDLQILVVDDEPDSRELLKFALESEGASVVVAKDAAEAFEKLQHAKFDLMVSDIGMPDEDGFSLMKRIRELPKASGGNTPAIALTGYARTEDGTRALESGFQVHIAKPIDLGELSGIILNLAGIA
jgi:CheY-like chemotaxis protein